MDLDANGWNIILTGVIAVLIAFPGGLLLEKMKQRRKDAENFRSIIDTIQHNLKKNLELMQQMHRELPGGGVIYYNLELSPWPIILSKLYTIRDKTLKQEVLYIYYELSHLSRKIDLQLEEAFLSPVSSSDRIELRMALVNNGILGHITDLAPKVEQLRSRFDAPDDINIRLGDKEYAAIGLWFSTYFAVYLFEITTIMGRDWLVNLFLASFALFFATIFTWYAFRSLNSGKFRRFVVWLSGG